MENEAGNMIIGFIALGIMYYGFAAVVAVVVYLIFKKSPTPGAVQYPQQGRTNYANQGMYGHHHNDHYYDDGMETYDLDDDEDRGGYEINDGGGSYDDGGGFDGGGDFD